MFEGAKMWFGFSLMRMYNYAKKVPGSFDNFEDHFEWIRVFAKALEAGVPCNLYKELMPPELKSFNYLKKVWVGCSRIFLWLDANDENGKQQNVILKENDSPMGEIFLSGFDEILIPTITQGKELYAFRKGPVWELWYDKKLAIKTDGIPLEKLPNHIPASFDKHERQLFAEYLQDPLEYSPAGWRKIERNEYYSGKIIIPVGNEPTRIIYIINDQLWLGTLDTIPETIS